MRAPSTSPASVRTWTRCGVPYRARARAGPRSRLLHPDRLRVLRHRARRASSRPSVGEGATTAWSSCMGGRPTPGIGFGIGLDRLILALTETGALAAAETGPVAVVVGADPADTAGRLVVATDLRAAGIAARAELGQPQARQATRGRSARARPLRGDHRRRAGRRRGRTARPAGRDPEARRHRRPGARDRARPRRTPPRVGIRMTVPRERWSGGDAYEAYIGRWSRKVAPRFVDWLAIPPGARWMDVGCGTGALTGAILRAAPLRARYSASIRRPTSSMSRRERRPTRRVTLRGRRRGRPCRSRTDRSTPSSPASSSTSSRTSRAALTEMRRVARLSRHRGSLRLGLRRTDGPPTPVLRRGDRRGSGCRGARRGHSLSDLFARASPRRLRRGRLHGRRRPSDRRPDPFSRLRRLLGDRSWAVSVRRLGMPFHSASVDRSPQRP